MIKDNLLRYKPEKKYVFIDCETYDLNLSFASKNRPWQTTLFKYTGGKIIDRQDCLTKWTKEPEIGIEAARITRFDSHNNRYGMSMRQALAKYGEPQEATLEKIHSAFEWADYIVAHNGINFDFNLIKEWYTIHNRDWTFFLDKILDTRCLAQAIGMSISFSRKKHDLLLFQFAMANKIVRGLKTNLTHLGRNVYKIDHDYDSLHDAYSDLELNVKIFEKQLWEIDI